MRQKVFLHCALDHKIIHELNQACVHVDSTGFDLETIKKCTDRPRVISNIRTCDITDVPYGSAKIIGGMKDMKDSGPRSKKSMGRHQEEPFLPRATRRIRRALD